MNKPFTPALREPPHSIEAEQALLGAILVNNEAFYRVSDFLEPRHFFEPIHQRIFGLAGGLVRANKLATPVTLKTFLQGDLDIAGLSSISISRGSRPRRRPLSMQRTSAAPSMICRSAET